MVIEVIAYVALSIWLYWLIFEKPYGIVWNRMAGREQKEDGKVCRSCDQRIERDC